MAKIQNVYFNIGKTLIKQYMCTNAFDV